ncbi:MAG TPA: carboxypeptidase regulatory-like domain-containing protein [Candidatus Angelobacter sp.]|jgi:outer membrane receptor protein involved in Fe transport|nr:carboxypeptidase regulatory-like domain-containing protein [Candidatus Angelobacter sp.]
MGRFAKLQMAIIVVGLCSLGLGQVNTGNLTGLITDPSNAVVPHVLVTAQNPETGYSRSTETDDAGYYYLQDLPIGSYRVTVTGKGFAIMGQMVAVNTAEKIRRDFTLRISTSSETIEVTTSNSGLSPDDASIGTVITSDAIERTPLFLRNWDDLLRVVSGVQISRFTQQSGATSAGRTGDFNVHGVHSLQNNFLLDGIDNNTFSENVQELSTEASHPSVDTLQEFNIITNPYSAEYGRSPGAAVAVSTRSGTNQVHVLAYEYLRNQFFDANDFFSNRNHLARPENNQNQFGGSIGGPLIKNKLFGFFNYEGTRIHQGVSRITTVPLANERIGDFSPAAAALAGVKYPTIYDPTTGLPFANNQIPNLRIDPVVSNLMALFPAANLPGNVNNFARNALVTDNNDGYNGRIDWNVTPSDNVFGRYSYFNRFRFLPGNFGGIADGTSTSALGRQTLTGSSLAIGWTHIFSPRIINDFHFGFVRNFSYAQQDPFGKNAADQFVPGIPNNPAIAGGVPLTTFANFGFLGSPDFLPKRQIPQQFEWFDTLSQTFKRHTLKLGFSFYGPMRNIFQDEPGTRGDLGFTGVFTACHQASGCPANSGLSYADGLLGLVQSTQLTNVFFVDQRLWMIGGFAQDDWKVTPKLTLNLGLRYDFASPVTEAQNRTANFDPANGGSLVFAKDGSLEQRSLVKPYKTAFSPRAGFAYSPGWNTVIRGGYGIYYTLFERFGSENQMALNPPFLINKTLASNTTPVLIAKNGFPANFLDPGTVNLQDLRAFHIRAVNPDNPAPMVQQWSFGVQHQFSSAWSAELNYVGTKSTHLDRLSDFNQPIIVNGVSTGKVPFPNFGYIEYLNQNGYGYYHGLEATLNRRFSKGLDLRVAYTYSRSLDNTPQELESNSGAPPDGRNPAAWYGLSDFDIPHRVAVSYTYELPFGHGKSLLNEGWISHVFGGFRTSGIYTYYSGHPFTVNLGGGRSSILDAFGQATAVPNVTGATHLVGNPNCWFFASSNPACTALAPMLTSAYQITAPGVVGNSGRNTLRGPHTTVFDAALTRDFHVTERANLQFRWEVFNISNTPEFGQPNGNLTSSAAGTITTLSGDPRVMQFALRVSF